MGGDITVRSVYGRGSAFTARIPQKANSGERFAVIEDPRTQRALVYETRSITADSLRWSLDNLAVPYDLAVTEDAFLEALRREQDGTGKNYTFILIPQAQYVRLEPVLANMKLQSRLVLLVNYGAESGIHNIRFLILPAHTLSIANIINNRQDPRSGDEKGKTAARFTAPDARVLIVDDIATNLKVAQGLLLPYNMNVDICSTGAAAIELFRENNYDLVFMDHMVPGMDGIEATAAIRSWEKEQTSEFSKETPIVALTANAIAGMKDMFLERGFNDYLAKPIEMPKLHQILKKWIPREKQIRERAEPEGEDALPDSAFFDGKEVEGIDLEAGVERYRDGSIYLEILRSYAASTPDFLETLRGVSRKTLENYAITVHGIKGASYQICAVKAGKEAELLETAARAQDWKTIESRNGAFIAAMERLLQNLDRFLTDHFPADHDPAEPEEQTPDESFETRRSAMIGHDSKKIILAVDDMPLNLTAIRTILSDDFDVRLAKSPLAALTMLNTVRVDLALVDIEMPEMSGFEFVDRLRNNPAHPEQKDIPVIFVTSHETPDILERIASLDAACVTKPVIPRILLEKIKPALADGERKSLMPDSGHF
jgi:CheY-like chemotaxis protein/HPt (histidine-containing phosphotransfer) domain-containing protein